jgi:hypothetical protein
LRDHLLRAGDDDAEHDERVLVEYRSCIYHIWQQVSGDRVRHGTGSLSQVGLSKKDKNVCRVH